MKAVLFYERADVSMERIMEVYPLHKAVVDQFAAEGKVLAIGTFANSTDGSMGIFKDKASVEEFVSKDPFVSEGLVGKITLKEWNEILL